MLPVPLFRMDGNESEYVGTINEIVRVAGRLEASGRIAGFAEGEVLAVHMHIDAQGVRPKDRGTDPRRIPGGAIVGARLAESANWPDALIVVGAGSGPALTSSPPEDQAQQPDGDLRALTARIEALERRLDDLAARLGPATAR